MLKNQKLKSRFLKSQGAYLLSELNDFKRTVESSAQELGWNKSEVEKITKGEASEESVNKFIKDCSDLYPVNAMDLTLGKNDCQRGVKYFSFGQSKDSFRIFDRKNKSGERTPYYEYRDTATSCLSSYRPEWIKQLRVVDNSDPHNPDVIYNNGHFMHQVTFFVGPVNFYYEVDGVKYCEEMNTGDSNYITPFYPHSFASRNKDKEAYILAVTFGANVKKALSELYHLGKERSSQYTLDMKDKQKGVQDLLDYHLKNCRKTRQILQNFLGLKGSQVNVLDRDRTLSEIDIEAIAVVLELDPSDFILPSLEALEKVVVKKIDAEDVYSYPSQEDAKYSIWPLASTPKLPLVKSFKIDVYAAKRAFSPDFSSGLHTYVFNYGEATCEFNWIYEGECNSLTLNPGDSVYIQPFIEHQLCSLKEGESPQLYCVSIPGKVTLETQKELSELGDIERTVFETTCWFS